MKELHELRDMLCDELKEYGKKGELKEENFDEKGNVTGNKDMVDGNVFNRQDHSWVDNISKLKVTKLGDAGAEHDKAKVILSSFHAG